MYQQDTKWGKMLGLSLLVLSIRDIPELLVVKVNPETVRVERLSKGVWRSIHSHSMLTRPTSDISATNWKNSVINDFASASASVAVNRRMRRMATIENTDLDSSDHSPLNWRMNAILRTVTFDGEVLEAHRFSYSCGDFATYLGFGPNDSATVIQISGNTPRAIALDRGKWKTVAIPEMAPSLNLLLNFEWSFDAGGKWVSGDSMPRIADWIPRNPEWIDIRFWGPAGDLGKANLGSVDPKTSAYCIYNAESITSKWRGRTLVRSWGKRPVPQYATVLQYPFVIGSDPQPWNALAPPIQWLFAKRTLYLYDLENGDFKAICDGLYALPLKGD